jgi:hypothetical protein
MNAKLGVWFVNFQYCIFCASFPVCLLPKAIFVYSLETYSFCFIFQVDTCSKLKVVLENSTSLCSFIVWRQLIILINMLNMRWQGNSDVKMMKYVKWWMVNNTGIAMIIYTRMKLNSTCWNIFYHLLFWPRNINSKGWACLLQLIFNSSRPIL